jgi:hypothetical protein
MILNIRKLSCAIAARWVEEQAAAAERVAHV